MESRLEEEKENEVRIVTLHLISSPKSICSKLFSPKQVPSTEMIKELYSKFLKDDPLFHFFFEPDLIIRISSNTVLENINNYLKLKQIDFVTYDYPTPAPSSERYCYGESQR